KQFGFVAELAEHGDGLFQRTGAMIMKGSWIHGCRLFSVQQIFVVPTLSQRTRKDGAATTRLPLLAQKTCEKWGTPASEPNARFMFRDSHPFAKNANRVGQPLVSHFSHKKRARNGAPGGLLGTNKLQMLPALARKSDGHCC